MRIVFFGTPELAVPSLAALVEAHDVVAVVCQPDRPAGRGKTLTAPPVKLWAIANGIPVLQPQKLNDGVFEAWLRSQKPEICALTAYGRLLKQPILDVPPHGILNMHPSLLPLYRGPSPIQSAIINGESVTGVTIMRLTLDMDAGDILLQKSVPILEDDTGETLSKRLGELGGQTLREAVDAVAAGTAQFTPQDHSRATYCRLIEKRDGQIDWTRPARNIHNLVRGAQPWPAAHCMFEGQMLRIFQSAVVDDAKVADVPPGTVLEVDRSSVHVATGRGVLAVLAIQAPGKRVMPMSDFLCGHKIAPGARFEPVP